MLSRVLTEARLVGKDIVDQPYGLLIPPIPCAQPSVLPSDTEGRYSKGGGGEVITVPALFDPQRAMQTLGCRVISVHLLSVNPRQVLALQNDHVLLLEHVHIYSHSPFPCRQHITEVT